MDAIERAIASLKKPLHVQVIAGLVEGLSAQLIAHKLGHNNPASAESTVSFMNALFRNDQILKLHAGAYRISAPLVTFLLRFYRPERARLLSMAA